MRTLDAKGVPHDVQRGSWAVKEWAMKMKRPDYVVKRRSMPETRLPANAKAPSHDAKLVSYELKRRSGREARPPEKKRGHRREKMLLLGVKRVSHGVKEAESCVKGASQRATLPSDNESSPSENANAMSAQRRKAPESENPVPPEKNPVPRGGKRWPPGEKSPSQEFDEKWGPARGEFLDET
ncbi:hypothetical protein HMPREF9004_1475 [Schaalia cardiffensis F0333]|uniref:Uncharacterized protein n=2 Tax=Schaalia TaxID=2529408 RepID=N6W4V5_9ACTO|nr:hypothetical protein HMPREF9004_1475 [Schaalia cardiffensis F0333]